MAVRYLFENCTFDTDRRELRRGAELVPLAPQVFDLLDYLIRNRERVVSKDDLILAIWDGRSVSDAALTTRLNAVRGAIGDTGEKQLLIKTLPRKGFRFVGAVQEEKQGGQAESVGSATRGGVIAETPSSAARLSIVVLPFANLSGDPKQDYFVDGVTESLTTDLSRISGSFVIGRHTAFTYKDKAVDLRQIGRELNIRYVLEGSVQRGVNQLRVNVQLVDAETGTHLWAERFDKPVANLFEMQDEIVSRLASTLNAQLIAAEARRAERSLHPDAVDLVFQGRDWYNKGLAPDHLAQARGFFEKAIVLDPGNIEAMVGLARVDVSVAASFLTDDWSARFAAAEATVSKVLSLAPNHAAAHAIRGLVEMYTKRASQAIAECEQALALDRNSAAVHASLGMAKFLLGRGAETEAHINEAIRLSPRDTLVYRWFVIMGLAKMHLNADAEAVVWLRRGLDANVNYSVGYFHLAAALALLGEPDEARAAVQAGLALDPSFTIRRFRDATSAWHDNPISLAGRDRTIEGMRIAGVPEG